MSNNSAWRVPAAVAAAVAASIILSFALDGCNARPQSEIVFWAFGVEGEQVAKLIPEFERRNPGVSVRVQMIPWNAAHEKLLTAYASNSLPDLFQLGNTWIPEFQMLDALENLDPLLRESASLDDSVFFRGIWDTNVIDSALYGIPWYVDTKVLFYRTDLLAAAGFPRAPATWDEWFEVCRRIVQQRIAEYGVFFSVNNEWVPQVLMGVQKGSTLLKDQNMYGDFSGAEFREAMRTFREFFVQGLAPVRTGQIVNIYQGIADRSFAMFISGPWSIGEFRKRMPPDLQDKWMTAPLPGPEGAPGLSLAGGSSLVMLRSTPKKAEVWKLMEYLAEPGVQVEFYGLSGDLPSRVEAWKSPVLAGNRYAGAILEQLRHVVATPKVPEWEQIAQKVRELTELITMERMTVEEATTELDRAVDLILEKRRWMVRHAE
jgi:multiple sugar transport system substrate-binding protein